LSREEPVMSTSAQLMTEDDLFRLPMDHLRHELIKGELRTMAPTGGEHGAVTVNLTVPLGGYVKAKRLGRVFGAETGYTIEKNPDTVLAPDVSFLQASRIPPTGVTKKFIPGAPDLAVEVVSPGDTMNEVDAKVQDWLAAGTRLVWVVNPKPRTVTVHAAAHRPVILTEDQQLDGEDVVPGFSLPVREIFS
jgi:Uma2 family endonuclease